jgi:hypothetical protein
VIRNDIESHSRTEIDHDSRKTIKRAYGRSIRQPLRSDCLGFWDNRCPPPVSIAESAKVLSLLAPPVRGQGCERRKNSRRTL